MTSSSILPPSPRYCLDPTACVCDVEKQIFLSLYICGFDSLPSPSLSLSLSLVAMACVVCVQWKGAPPPVGREGGRGRPSRGRGGSSPDYCGRTRDGSIRCSRRICFPPPPSLLLLTLKTFPSRGFEGIKFEFFQL